MGEAQKFPLLMFSLHRNYANYSRPSQASRVFHSSSFLALELLTSPKFKNSLNHLNYYYNRILGAVIIFKFEEFVNFDFGLTLDNLGFQVLFMIKTRIYARDPDYHDQGFENMHDEMLRICMHFCTKNRKKCTNICD